MRENRSKSIHYSEMPFYKRTALDIKRNPGLYLMLLPVLLYYILFHYKPMYGALIAFMDFKAGIPIFENEWVGFQNFIDFFKDRNFKRVVSNTLIISSLSVIFSFPAPIILALLFNEIRSKVFSRVTQTISYLPHFISIIVIAGMIRDFTNSKGIITMLLYNMGILKEPIALLSRSEYFRPIYIISDIWQTIGYGSIIYLAALTGISTELYEAAKIDGAGRWKQTLHITFPGIMPTVMTMLILRIGNLMNVGFEKIMLMYNPQTYSVADVISTYVYRVGISQGDFSYSTAVGLFNSVINFAILIMANQLSKRTTEVGLW